MSRFAYTVHPAQSTEHPASVWKLPRLAASDLLTNSFNHPTHKQLSLLPTNPQQMFKSLKTRIY